MNACDFGSLCDTIRIWKQGSGFRDFVREKNYYSWYFQALNIDICESGIVSMGEEKYYKNDCLKIIMDIYKALGSIRKLLVIIQMTKGQSAPLLFFRVFFNYTIMCFMFFIIRNSNK